ncbi:MAG: Thioredoxin reductase [uncultured Chthoniobacterales bacterium]|uniref:Thioredoxin reductase n=1 Tax=uncultured Chthoniobacterales bacterium TaxID=1836801 RepID=A0A6J4HN11_9BACT|nr:MAG: Thioredoxin reductase [uncultured Chthoniobacterales bacterium]
MLQYKDLDDPRVREVIIIGGGVAGLSAAIYLGRAQRDTLVISSGRSMAHWEPIVGNYLGFSDGISGDELVRQGRLQAERHDVHFADDRVEELRAYGTEFVVRGRKSTYHAKRILLATGIFHLPPEIRGVSECLGHSMFFCKDCDGIRVREKRIAICGANDEAVEYALGMLLYSPCVMIATNGEKPHWSEQHARWIEEYEIPVHLGRIHDVEHEERQVLGLHFEDGQEVKIDNIFTTRGDIFHTGLAEQLGAELDEEGQIKVDAKMRTSVPNVYAAGCVTPANCQMIIAAGQGATAGQAINRDLFEEGLQTHTLRRFRAIQLLEEETVPEGV